MNILVAYASKYGSTVEVAAAIAGVLRRRASRVDVRAAAEVEDLGGYDAVVLGGGMYMGRWHRNARGFARHFADELEALPVAVFALGPVDDVPDHVAGAEKQFRRTVEGLPFEPVATALFGGVIDPSKLHFPFSHMAAADLRDWAAIREWALELADELSGAALQTGR
jgi:menaquinone-dependent protoporphyrinogen oxidase